MAAVVPGKLPLIVEKIEFEADPLELADEYITSDIVVYNDLIFSTREEDFAAEQICIKTE